MATKKHFKESKNCVLIFCFFFLKSETLQIFGEQKAKPKCWDKLTPSEANATKWTWEILNPLASCLKGST